MKTSRSKALATVLAVVLAVVVWWWQDSGDDTTPEARQSISGTPSPSQTPAPTSSEAPSTTPSPSASSTAKPSPPPSAAAQPSSATGRTGIDPASGLPWVAVEELPIEAEETLLLIDDGGPFPHDRDGITFGNFEGILPDRQRGYYAEYTVPTPGLSHRGARRIVTGDGGEYYWTEDHYESFERIDW